MNKKSSISSTQIPAWMVTFADLMALMMTFFVLLYSFSKVDEGKYKSIVDSLARGFDGVQWIKQRVTDSKTVGPEQGIITVPILIKPKPETEIAKTESTELTQTVVPQQDTPQPIIVPNQSDLLFEEINKNFENEIEAGLIYLEQKDNKVVIRFPEGVSFTSGSDQVVQSFVPIIHRISRVLKNAKGKIVIAGHTDDRAISTKRFRSNWELSTARAVSVAQHLLKTHETDPSQIVVTGHADTKPLVPNDSKEQRAINRRVEISISNDEDK